MIQVAPSGQFFSVMDFGGATVTTPGVTVYDSSGGVVIAHSTASIRNLGGGVRAKLLTDPGSAEGSWLVPVWDIAGALISPDEAVLIRTSYNPGSTTVSDLAGGAPGTLDSLEFTIKRNDTLPYLRRRILDGLGSPIDGASYHGGITAKKFSMRKDVAPDTGATTPTVHADLSVVTLTPLVVEFRWDTVAGSTSHTTDDSQGRPGTPFAGEFEFTFVDGTVETFPGDSYIKIWMPADLDPGINP